MEKIIAQGAEAIITLENNKILKNRTPKSYRHPELDAKIRKRRTKAEAKLLQKASELIPVPKLISSDYSTLTIDFVEGKKLSEHLESLDFKSLCLEIGNSLAKLHNAGIIHGDLTTSNMIYVSDSQVPNSSNPSNHNPHIDPSHNTLGLNINNSTNLPKVKTISKDRTPQKELESNFSKGKVFFIDFGLGFHSNKTEDKAVDLHLIKQALEAKHPSIYEKAFSSILEGYKDSPHFSQVLKRLEKVEKRGRYKAQY